jgi:hypothetical protein
LWSAKVWLIDARASWTARQTNFFAAAERRTEREREEKKRRCRLRAEGAVSEEHYRPVDWAHEQDEESVVVVPELLKAVSATEGATNAREVDGVDAARSRSCGSSSDSGRVAEYGSSGRRAADRAGGAACCGTIRTEQHGGATGGASPGGSSGT